MKKAFTLAEVLITLGIIGVVAVLTLPSLIARYKEKVLLSQIKKSYSNLLNVVNLYRAETGDETYSGLFNPDDTADVIAERFTRYYKTTSVCTTSDTTGKCALYQVKLQKPTNNGHGKLGYEDYGRPRLFLSDGSSIYIRKYFSDIAGTCGFLRTICVTDANGLCTAATITYLDARCGILGLDVNGLK
ncbi:MAG: type II secretion system GspH family protein, partial [Heliobacteriaceae bacterium]|nr:type II secretion system GspH family protein [Heliobacteriaceae bacterium]